MKPKGLLSLLPLQRASLTPLVICTTMCATAGLHAADGTWIGTTSGGTWSDTANWAGGIVADGSGFTANFSTLDLPAGQFSVLLAADRTIGNLNFNDTDAATTAGTWQISGTNILTLAGTPVITTGVNTNILTPLAGTSGFTKAGSGTLLLTANNNNTTVAPNNVLSGPINLNAGQITLRVPGNLGPNTNTLAMANATTLRLEHSGSNSNFSGVPITVAASSSVTFSSSSAGNGYSGLVTGPVGSTIFFNGDFALSATGTQQLGSFLGTANIPVGQGMRYSSTSGPNGNGGASTSFVVDGQIYTRNGSSGGSVIHLGAVTGSGILRGQSNAGGGRVLYRVGNLGTSTTFDGTFVDGGNGSSGLDKVGAGRLTLTGASPGTGPSTITDGEVRVMGSTAFSTLAVGNGASLSGTGSVGGTTSVALGGSIAPGDGGIGTLTVNSLSLATGSILDYNFGAGNDTIAIPTGGALALGTGIEVDVNGFSSDGTYNLITYAAGITPSGASAATAFTAVGGSGSKIYTFSDNGSAIRMTISSSDPSNYWKPDGGGSWGVAGNWTKGTVPNAAGAIARIGPGPEGAEGGFTDLAFEITLDGPRTVGTLSFDDDGFPTNITLSPGLTTPGTITFDNGASTALLASISGYHTISANVAIDPDDLSIDIGLDPAASPVAPFVLTLSGTVSGTATGAALTKTGAGTLVLTGTNTYDGGTTLTGGTLAIQSSTNLGVPASSLAFSGGTLRLDAEVTGVTRAYQITGPNQANINTNGFALGFDGQITPVGGSTGGIVKTGGGVMTIGATQASTFPIAVNGGEIVLPSGITLNATTLSSSGGTGNRLHVNGGTFTASGATSLNGSGLAVSGGTAAFNGGINANTGNPSSNVFMPFTGGTSTAAFITMGRCATAITNPTAGSTTQGLYVNGGTLSVAGDLQIGMDSTNTNSTASARMDSGSLSVGGLVSVSVSSPDRWSILDLNGGTFTSTDAVTGLRIGVAQTGSCAVLVRGTASATVERILMQQPVASTETSLLNVSGGSLYIGSGGIVGNNNGGTGILDIQLGQATLGAKASWETAVAATLNGSTVVKAADASNAAFDIALNGALGGTGGFEKTGAGKLTLGGTNTFAGIATVSAGTLDISGDSSGATGGVTVASGATLAGSGNIGGNVSIASGARQAFAVAATAGAQTTRTITGTLTLTAGHIVDLGAAATPEAGTYVLATATGGISGTLGTVNANGVPGTLAISGNSIVLTVGSGGSAYDTWATTNNVTGGPTDDDENDSIDNVLEFVLGGNPKVSDTQKLPTATTGATNFVFTFTRQDVSLGEVGLVFQYGSTLTGWTDVAIGETTGTSGPGVAIVDNGASDTITVTVAKGANTKLFGRLRAVK